MLPAFFDPHGVAVIGASADPSKLGHAVLKNILDSGYDGPVYAVNPKGGEILGVPVFPDITVIPDRVDLAVIVIPARLVAEELEQCGKKGCRGVIVISAGFREVGLEGKRAEQHLVQIAHRYGMDMLGPNCLGILDTVIPINASFARTFPEPGTIAFMTQSGALATAILDWAKANQMGFSRFVSLGNKAELNEIDFLQAWNEDEHTDVIIAYLEGIVDGPRFMQVARETTRRKPVIAIKSGTTDAGQRAVSSHTGTLAGSERAYDAAFRQAGVLRAASVQDLFDFAQAFATQPQLRGPNVAIVTNAGGPGIMATDALERAGLRLAQLNAETVEGLRARLPSAASALNPIDVLGDALADRYRLGVEAALADPNVDAVLVILTPQVYTEVDATAHVVGRTAQQTGKPVLGVFMGSHDIASGVQILAEYGVPNYIFPERAVAALGALDTYRQWLQRPEPEYRHFDVDQSAVRALFDRVRAEGRLQLGDAEARAILQAYNIRTPQSEVASTADDVVRVADRFGYPVVMKIASPDILHKSDIGGVAVGIESAEEVRTTFQTLVNRGRRFMPDAEIWGVQMQEMVPQGREVLVGVSRDPQFGHLIVFGLGGIYVEVLKDVTFRVAPLSVQEAAAMTTEIRAAALLRGVRGEPPADLAAAREVLLRISQLVTDFPEIVELDINPLVLLEEGEGAIAIDMRLVLEEQGRG